MSTPRFADRLLPAPVGGGYREEGYWVWCGSVARGDDGRYHMFASRWRKSVPFCPNWLTNSEIVRAVADSPAGPYRFAGTVLPPRGAEFWDGRMTHNPSIHRCGDTWLLYYTGTTFEDAPPTDGPASPELRLVARANQRIGLATAPAPEGPWTRRDAPVLEPRPGRWDALMTANPAPCVRPDGSALLVYKAVGHDKDLLRLGVASAPTPESPYERLSDDPILRFDETGDHVEDPYVWWNGHGFEMIMKDMEGGLGGEYNGGIHAHSPDGVRWTLSDPPQAYSRTIRWSDGTVTTQGSFERPQLLIEDGRPTHLFAATADGPGGFWRADNTWNMVVPLRPDA